MQGGIVRLSLDIWSRRMSLLQRFAVTSLVVFVALGVALAYLLGRSIQSHALAEATRAADDTLHARLLHELRRSDLATPMTGTRYAGFSRFVDNYILSGRTVRVKIWDPNGTVMYSSDPRIVGHTFDLEDKLREALRGSVTSDVSSLTDAENRDDRVFGQLLEVYIPIRFSAHSGVAGAFEIYQRYAPVGQEIAQLQHEEYVLLACGLLLVYLLLFGVVGAGSKRIEVQRRELSAYTQQLESSYEQTIASLAAAVDARDSSTELHSERVTMLAVELGRAMGFPDAELRDLERGALLHDVGKIGVRDAILLKPGRLTDDEWRAMRAHPEIGYRMLRHVAFLEPALPLVRHHHERWDGNGYPLGLRGDQIPLAARVFAIVDAYDAMTSDRPYRPALSHEVAMERLRGDAGSHFDPAVVAAFQTMMRQRDPNHSRARLRLLAAR